MCNTCDGRPLSSETIAEEGSNPKHLSAGEAPCRRKPHQACENAPPAVKSVPVEPSYPSKQKTAPQRGLHCSGYTGSVTVVMLVLTVFSMRFLHKHPLLFSAEKVGARVPHVAAYGFLSAVASGLGAVPFIFVGTPKRWWLGVCNALAAGMMIAASLGLVFEGVQLEHHSSSPPLLNFLSHPWTGLMGGILLGVVFMRISKALLDEADDVKVVGMTGLAAMDARRAILVVAVMTLHSFSEGIGIGVSFGGHGGHRLGPLISTTLCIHNIPEGVAVALVLVPKGVDLLSAALWCVFTSIPQVIMAVPAFMFVGYAEALLPCGLGFAAGAMLWMSCTDLIQEARDDLNNDLMTFLVMGGAALCMGGVQWAVG